jgi:hypothetical protein
MIWQKGYRKVSECFGFSGEGDDANTNGEPVNHAGKTEEYMRNKQIKTETKVRIEPIKCSTHRRGADPAK